MSPGWYIFEIPAGRQRRAVAELRGLGLDVVWLFCFVESLRAHRTVKKRRADMRRPVPALGEYVFIEIGGEGDLERIEALRHGIRRMPWPSGTGYAPRLSPGGIAWLEHPPRQLFHDTQVTQIQIQARNPKPDIKVGDRVGAFTCAFDGYYGPVVSISGSRAMVKFDESMFEMSVPLDALVLVPDEPAS